MKRIFFINLLICIFFFLSCKNSSCTLIIGDSLFSGFKISHEDSVVALLNNHLPGTFLNITEIGLSLKNVKERLSEFDEIEITHVIIELGANDFLRNVDTDVIYENLYSVIEYFKTQKIKVCVINFYDSSMLKFYKYFDVYNIKDLENVNLIFSTLEDVLVINNIWDGKFSCNEFKVDDFHPNSKGSKLIAFNILNYLKKNNFYSN